MKSILHNIYYGKEIPLTRPIPRDYEYQKINLKIKDEEQYFYDKLSKDDQKRFNDFIDLLTQASGIDEADIFSNGFKLGAKLLAEVFAEMPVSEKE